MRFFPSKNFDSKNSIDSKNFLNIDSKNFRIPMLRAEYQFQIFVKLLSGKTITMDVRSSDSIREVQAWFINMLDPVQRQFHHENCYLTFQSKILYDGYMLSDYNIQKDCTIYQAARLLGGGKRGSNMIKTVVKSKTADKTLPSDSSLFTNVFKHSEAVTRTTSVNFQSMLKTMPLNDLKSLYEYLMHDHSRKDMKLQKLTEWCTEIKELVTVQKKIHTAIDMMTTLIMDNIQETFVDSEGEFSMKELIRAVDNRIAVVSDEAMTDI